jgi:hemolysin activation/secretion protein
MGRGLFLWNTELRWRAHDFTMAGRSFHLVFSGFVDTGRVWDPALVAGQILSNLQTAFGIGVRVGVGENFIAAVDVGHSVQATAPMYIGLGYLY